MEYDLKWHIEDWNPHFKLPEYDKLLSLKIFLERQNISSQDVERIISSEKPFWEARRLFQLPNGVIETVYADESV
jgi:hypothetical protein